MFNESFQFAPFSLFLFRSLAGSTTIFRFVHFCLLCLIMSCLTLEASVRTPRCFYEHIKRKLFTRTRNLSLNKHSLFMYKLFYQLKNDVNANANILYECPKLTGTKNTPILSPEKKKHTRNNHNERSKCHLRMRIECAPIDVIRPLSNSVGWWLCVCTRRIMASD